MILNSTLHGHCPEVTKESLFGAAHFCSTSLRRGVSVLPFTTFVINHIKRAL